MKSYATFVHEFSTTQRKELEALFIVLDWTKDYQKKYPNNPIGQEWLNATELTIRIIYDDAFSAMRNQGIAFHSGSDTTEAPPELISSIMEELSKNSCSPFVKIESPNYYYFERPSTSSESNDMVNFMYFGPAYRIEENSTSSTEDVPFGFQFPHSMHFNFDDKRQESSVNLDKSISSLSSQSTQAVSSIALSESEQKEMFLPFPAMYLVRPKKDETPLHMETFVMPEATELYEKEQLDLTKDFDSSLESQSSIVAVESFRISSGIIPLPKSSDIAEQQCSSPFCLCSSIMAAYKTETNEYSLEDDDISEVPIEPYLEVENISFPKLELPDLLDDAPESFMLLQPFNTSNNTVELETSNESVTSFSSLTIPGTSRNNPEDRELMIQPFNTTATPGNISFIMDTSLNDSLGVADLGLDEDIANILQRKCPMDNGHEYIRQERLRILLSYEKSRLSQQKKTDENGTELNENNNFATSTPNWRHCESSKDKFNRRDY